MKLSAIIGEPVAIINNIIINNIDSSVGSVDVQIYDIIIGPNFTELPHVTYLNIDNKLVLSNRNDFVFNLNPVIDDQISNLKIAWVENKIEIPSRSMNFIQVTVHTDETISPIQNTSNETISIKEGADLGKIFINIAGNIL